MDSAGQMGEGGGGFNGAITFSLWKSAVIWPAAIPLLCFNGAITFSLWK